MTRAQLRSKILAGDTLTIMGAPIGSGQRMGIDRDLVGALDGDVPRPPSHRHERSQRVGVLADECHWLPARARHKLPAAAWAPDTSERGVVNSEFNVTNSLSLSNLFFRLREL
jgi:hypothetical protein